MFRGCREYKARTPVSLRITQFCELEQKAKEALQLGIRAPAAQRQSVRSVGLGEREFDDQAVHHELVLVAQSPDAATPELSEYESGFICSQRALDMPWVSPFRRPCARDASVPTFGELECQAIASAVGQVSCFDEDDQRRRVGGSRFRLRLEE